MGTRMYISPGQCLGSPPPVSPSTYEISFDNVAKRW